MMRQACMEYLKNEDFKQLIRVLIKPITNIVYTELYNELYVYIWLICVYHIFFIFIILAIFYMTFCLANPFSRKNIHHI
jgi:hypothetical protein